MRKYVYYFGLVMSFNNTFGSGNSTTTWKEQIERGNISPLNQSTLSEAKKTIKEIEAIINEELEFLKNVEKEEKTKKTSL